MRRLLPLAVTTLITAGVLALLLTRFDGDSIVAALGSAEVSWLLVGLAGALVLRIFQAAELLRVALLAYGVRVPYRVALTTTVGSLGVQAVLPWGAGHTARIAYLSRAYGTDVSASSAATITIIWLKVILACSLVVVGWVALPEAPLAVGVSMLALVAVLAATPALAMKLGPRLIRRNGGTGRLARVGAALCRIEDNVRPAVLIGAGAHALFAVLANLAVFGVLLVAVGGPMAPLAILTYVPIAWLVARLPLTVHGVGTREAVVVVVLGSFAEPEVLLAASLLYSAVSFLIPALLGSVITWPFVSRIVRGQLNAVSESDAAQQ